MNFCDKRYVATVTVISISGISMKFGLTLLLAMLAFSFGIADGAQRSHSVEFHGISAPADKQTVNLTDSQSPNAPTSLDVSDPVAADSKADRHAFTEIPGERIDPRSGELTLTATDLVVPGPAGMDIVVSRTRRSTFFAGVQQTLRQEHSFQEPLADWRLDIPYIQTSTTGVFIGFDDQTGKLDRVVLDTANAYEGGNVGVRGACVYPEPPYWGQTSNILDVDRYWFRGARILGLPGTPSLELTRINAKAPLDTTIVYGGPDNWIGRCEANPRDGSMSRFVVSAPDGRKYYFDEPTFGNSTFGNPLGATTYGYMRTYVSRIEDRNGNSIAYEYDNCIKGADNVCQVYEWDQYDSDVQHYFRRDYAYVSKITSSDQREVDFTWERNPFCGRLDVATCPTVITDDNDALKGTANNGAPLFRLAKFTHAGRTWQFKYSDEAAGADKSRYLEEVDLPNGQFWKYSFSSGINSLSEPSASGCGQSDSFPMIQYQVRYPEGAAVSYTMQPHWFMRRNKFDGSATHDSCWLVSAVALRSVVDGMGATADVPANSRWCYSSASRSPYDDHFRVWTHVLTPTKYELFEFQREVDPTNSPNKAALEGRMLSSYVFDSNPNGTENGFPKCPASLNLDPTDPPTGYLRKTTYDYDQPDSPFYKSNAGYPFYSGSDNTDIEIYSPAVAMGTPITSTIVEQPDVGGSAKYTTRLSGFVNVWYPKHREETVRGGSLGAATSRYWLTTYSVQSQTAPGSTMAGVFGLVLQHCLVASSTSTDCPTDSTGKVVQGTVSSYDSSTANLSTVTDYGKGKTYTYFPVGNLAAGDVQQVTDERQNTTTYSNYALGIPQTISLPGGDQAQISQEVNSTGTVKSVTNARNNKTSFEYDERNRLKSVTPPIGDATTITWAAESDSNANQTKTIVTGVNKTVKHYDGFGRLVETDVSDTGAHKETITKTSRYDSIGRLVFESYPNSVNGLKYTYDALDRRWKTTRTADDKVTYTEFSSPETQTTYDYNLHSTVSTYKSYGAPSFEQLTDASTSYTSLTSTGSSSPATAETSYERDKLGFATSVTQGAIARTYALDAKRKLTEEYLPEIGAAKNASGFNVGYCRDDGGNLLSKWVAITDDFSCDSPPASPVFTNSYDERNRLTGVAFGDSVNTPDVSVIEYTPTNKVKRIVKGTVEIDMDYDAAENLTYEIYNIDGYKFRLYYTYDSLDHLSSIQYPSGKTLQVSADAFGRTRAITDTLTSVDYHPIGLPKTITYANGEVTSIAPTVQNYVDTIITMGAGNTAVSLAYGYDDNGNATSIVDGLRPGDGMFLGYDELNRQISTQYTPNYQPGTIYYRGYDGIGNVTFHQTPEKTLFMNYDTTNNRLQSVSGDATLTLSYDGLGNVSSDGQRALTFDKSGNLQSSQAPVIKSFIYDGRDRIIEESTAQGRKYYVYSGEKLMFDFTPDANTYTEYVYLMRQLVGSRVVTNASSADISRFLGNNWSPK